MRSGIPGKHWTKRDKTNAVAGLLAILLSLSSAWWLVPAARAEDERVDIDWSAPGIDVTWTDSTYGTATGTIVGDPVIVPGDRGERTATVKNAGPSSAMVIVQIVNVTVSNADDTVNTDLEDLVHLFWDINGDFGHLTWSQARLACEKSGVAYTVSFRLGQGEEFPLTAGYHFSAESTTGKSAGAASSVLSFDVRITMQGDYQTRVGTGGMSSTHCGIIAAILLVLLGIICLVVSSRISTTRQKTDSSPICARATSGNPRHKPGFSRQNGITTCRRRDDEASR